MSPNAIKRQEPDVNQSYGNPMGAQALQMERLFPVTAEQLWAYLTESDKRAQWLAAGTLEPKTGGKLELRFDHTQLTPHQEEIPEEHKGGECATVTGSVTHYEPHSLLGYTWCWGEDVSEVTFTLTPEGDQTRLILTHRNITRPTDRICIAGGWHTHLGILLDKLNGHTPAPFWATHMRLQSTYETLLGA